MYARVLFDLQNRKQDDERGRCVRMKCADVVVPCKYLHSLCAVQKPGAKIRFMHRFTQKTHQWILPAFIHHVAQAIFFNWSGKC